MSAQHHTLPDEILSPLSDELEAIENLAGRLRKHAAADAFADHPDTLGQLDLLACSIGIVRIAEGLGKRVESLREPHGRHNEIALELTQAEAIGLKCLADSWGVSMESAAGRIVMEEMQRRFGMPEEPKKAA